MPDFCKRALTEWIFATSLCVGGCGHATSAGNSGARAPTQIEVPRTIVTPENTASIPELYAHANELAERGEHAQAAREFMRVATLDPNGELADDALFQAGSEHDAASEFGEAALSYQQLARRFPKSELRTGALVRATRLLAHLERYREADELAEHLLAEKGELGPFERVVLYGAAALGRLEADDEQGAQTFIEKGREVIDANQLDAAGRVSRDLASLYYALGELRRRRAERITFQPLPANFAGALEQRCQLLLDAQSAYSDSMRAYDAHWSTMAGFRVGELYEKLHEDVMKVTPPASADTLRKRQLFEGAMRLRYAILLEKALKMIEHTLSMAERTGERSAWVEKSQKAKATIEQAMKREDAAIAALPYSRATLQLALDMLQRKHAPESATPYK
jgi:tetratricopeptide (TPR) repeat protein